jgi:hypothetical protein
MLMGMECYILSSRLTYLTLFRSGVLRTSANTCVSSSDLTSSGRTPTQCCKANER